MQEKITTLRHSPHGRSDRIVICGSMSFFSTMLEQKQRLRMAGILGIIPDPDTTLFDVDDEGEEQLAKRRLSMKHIRRVRDQRTFGILVVNPDKHGIPDYIGPNAFAEIAVALAHYKRIYLLHGIPDFYREELRSWQALPLNGHLSVLIEDHRKSIALQSIQLSLFDDQ